MKTSYILIIFLLFYGVSLEGQNENTAPFKDLIPSPNSCALVQYADFPVSLYTGTPTIEIPIYTIDLGAYKLPVSLSYHASGIRVAQEASWVGLGWALNAGGAIMRTIKGRDDIDNEGYYSNTYDIPEKGEDILNSNYTRLTYDNRTHLFYQRLTGDTEPDVFYYNFAGYSGRFYCKCGGEKMQEANPGSGFITTNPEDNLRIEKLYLNNTTIFIGFKITVPDGTSYNFVQPEMKFTDMYKNDRAGMADQYGPYFNFYINVVNKYEYTTGWYLKDIYYPNGDRITFEYDVELNAYVSPVNVSQYTYHILAQEGTKIPEPFFNNKAVYSVDLTTEYPRLKRIKWKNGNIYFAPSETQRKDIRSLYDVNHNQVYPITNAQSLKEIRIYGSGNQTKLLKKYRFHTSYFAPDSLTRDKRYDYLCHRLKLDSITLNGTSERSLMYRMEYDTRNPLPDKNSFSCDYWGYYNGKNNNCLYPSVVTDRDYIGRVGEVAIPEGTTLPGADRSVNPRLVTSSILTALETPEGGRTEFSYQPNQVKGDVVRFPTSLEDGTFKGSVHFVKPAREHLRTFEFEMPCYGYVDFDFRYHGNEFHAAEEKGTAIVYLAGHYFTEKDIDDRESFMMHKRKLYLSKGKHTLNLQSNTTYVQSEITLKFYELPYYVGLPPSCGVRISKMKSPVSTKTYEYVDKYKQSTGILLRDLLHTVREVYYYSEVNSSLSIFGQTITAQGTTAVLKHCSAPVNPMESQTAGVLFGYSGVRVLTETDKGNLREEFYYYNRKEKEPTIPGFPGEYVFTNGKLKRHCVYKDDKLVKSSYYTYDEVPLFTLKGLREDEGNFFNISSYKIPFKFCALSVQRDSTMDIHGNDPIVHSKTTNYKYNLDNYQPREITNVVTDRNRSEIQELFYTTDFKDRSPYKEMCKKTNMICTPVEENFYKGVQKCLVRKTLHTYKENKRNIHGGCFVPDADFTYYQPEGQIEPAKQYGDFSLYKKADINYVSYDSLSNHISIESRMGQSAVYIWGYHRRYVVAQIFNATLEEVKAQGIDIDKIGGTAEPIEAQWQALHSLRNKFPKADVYVMTYEPEVGITSKTDGRGITTYYEYDDMGRLNCIRDNNRNIIKTNHLKLATEK